MEDMLGILVLVVVVLAVGGGILLSIFHEKKRREQLQAAAEEMGLTFFPEGDPVLMDRLGGFKLFNQGRSRKMKNLIQGDSGEVTIAIFDYQYTTGSGKNSNTHNLSVAAIQSPELNSPDFTLRPEGMFDKLGSALGFQDIDIETHPDFSRMFVLQSSNEDAIRKFFTPKLLEFFESKPGISVEARPGAMFFYRPRKRVKPEELKDQLAQAYEIFGYMVDRS